jgi:cytochrome P450
MQTITRAVLSPPLLASLITEIRASSTSPSTFDLKGITTSPLFRSVYLESLRWATASPSPRVVRQDTQLGPYHLKKGNMAMVHSRTLQMDEPTWCIPGKPESHPSKFWAERFLDGDTETEKVRVEENAEAESNYSSDIKASHPIPKPLNPKQHEVVGAKSKEMQARMLALRPFGGGTTLCPGRHFATNEIMGGLAALLLRLEIEVDEDALERNGSPLPDLSKQGGLFPDRGLICRVRRRKGV